ncbi:MAG: hypothetical protein ACKOUM_03620 [Sphingopyxis sp.]
MHIINGWKPSPWHDGATGGMKRGSISGWGRGVAMAGLSIATSLTGLALATPAAADTRAREQHSIPGEVTDRRVQRTPGVISDRRPPPNQTRPLPEIIARVQNTPPFRDMDYIGLAAFEPQSMTYVLRFLNGRQVVAVQVDARTGRILATTL